MRELELDTSVPTSIPITSKPPVPESVERAREVSNGEAHRYIFLHDKVYKIYK